MTNTNGPSPKMRNAIVSLIVGLWASSVLGQMAAQVFKFEWVTPTGMNEIATAVVMWVLARNHQANKSGTDEKDEESANE